MSRSSPAPDEEDQPRRGGRIRKQVERLDPGPKRAGKQRREEDEDMENGQSEEESDAEDGEAQPARKGKNAVNGNRKPRPRPASTKAKKKVNGDVDPEAPEGIKTDCPLFNAILSPDIALQPLIEDWVETYQQAANDEVSERAAVQEIVLFFIRCCGLTADIEEGEALDADGVVDVLERIQDDSVKTTAASYPLISKTKTFRAFRTNLNLFIPHFIQTLSLTPLLYQTPENTSHTIPLIPLLLNWLHSMSSSPLRPIRHTSTFLTLKINSALCDVAAGVSKDLSLKQRQKENEAKKSGSGAAYQKRLKDSEVRVKEAHERKVRLEEYMQENFDVLVVHRLRDADPAIRTDCLKELGVWVKKYPEKYVSTQYLNYFTRGCNDPNSHARLETVKALSSLFAKDTFVNNARTVTLRLAPRIIEMALRDVDLPVRVHAINVITAIDQTGILQDEDEEQREKVAKLMFDHEPRIRKAVGGFVHGLWDERKEKLKSDWAGARGQKKKRAGGISEEDMVSRLEWKALANILVETAQSLEAEQSDPSTSRPMIPTTSVSMTRASAAVEALYSEVEQLQDWQGLVDYLLLDHSTADEDMWLLADEEEDFMLQVLIACIRREETDEDEHTKTLMKILPRLFAKHQTDVARMAGILSIPERMNLSLYLDMRMSTAYESLWDDVTKQFMRHTDPAVLSASIQAINHLSANLSMAAANTAKLTELTEGLFATLRDAIDGEEVFSMSMDEDKLAQVEAILLRVLLLEKSRDLVEVMENEDQQSSGWDIVCAFAERGDVGYKEEAKLVEYATQIIFLHMTWLFKQYTTEKERLSEMRDRALEVFQKLALKERTNAAESVRRQAFISFLNLHVLFSAKSEAPAAKACPLRMADEIQHKLGGAFQAAVERYASDIEDQREEDSVDQSQQFLFLQLVSVFVGAVRCGVLEVDHAKEPLAHYGRFGQTYDAVVKKLVDVLRDEGIYNKDAETVQNVASSALQTSFNAFLDTEDEDPLATISLAKVISSAFIVHGTHFTVLKQIHPGDVYDMHLSLIDVLTRKVASYVKQERGTKNKDARSRYAKKRAQALTLFRVLILLLGPITGRDALRIKQHLEEAIQSTTVEVNANKAWDGYRQYEKRLISIASKDPNVKMASKKVAEATDEEREDPRDGARAEEGSEEGTPTPDARPTRKTTEGGEEDDEEAEAVERPNKRAAEEEEDILEFNPPEMQMDYDLSLDLPDLELDLENPGSQLREDRGRSVSVDPVPKGVKRKKPRRF